MFENFAQLPPVGDTKMFIGNNKNKQALPKFTTFCQLDTVLYLKYWVWQADNHGFEKLPLSLHESNNSLSDCELLSKQSSVL